MPDRRPLPVLTLLALLAGCSASPPSTATQTTGKPEAPAPQVAVTSDRLAGRWILSPGDCHMPPSEAPEQGSPVVSPAGAVLTLRNDPGQPGQFTVVQTLATRLHPHDLAVSDLDGNGWPDIVTTGAGVYPDFYSDVVEVFLDRHDSAAGTMSPAVATITPGTASGWWIATADLDGDGQREILMPLSGSVLLWRRDPERAGALVRWVELR